MLYEEDLSYNLNNNLSQTQIEYTKNKTNFYKYNSRIIGYNSTFKKPKFTKKFRQSIIFSYLGIVFFLGLLSTCINSVNK